MVTHMPACEFMSQISKRRTNSFFLQDEERVYNIIWQITMINLRDTEAMDTHTLLNRRLSEAFGFEKVIQGFFQHV